ncbi:MAG: hypothetical protein ACRDYB_12000 [Acidimicrobiales bacterium]
MRDDAAVGAARLRSPLVGHLAELGITLESRRIRPLSEPADLAFCRSGAARLLASRLVARFGRAKSAAGDKGGGNDARRDALNLVVAYVKQETLDPLKGLARFVAFGVAGSVAITLGTVMLLVAALRVLQTETGTFHGNLSWIPYVIVVALATVVIGLSAWRIMAGPAARRGDKPAKD